MYPHNRIIELGDLGLMDQDEEEIVAFLRTLTEGHFGD